jgi:hypothetical protein
VNEISTRQTECWAESWAGEPGIFLPDAPGVADDRQIRDALEQADRALAPGDPAAVLTLLTKLAVRHGLDLPDDDALEADLRILSRLPPDLLIRAFEAIWMTWRYRRMPTCGDFHAVIEDDLRERRSRRNVLSEAQLKRRTAEMREQWNRECRERRMAGDRAAASSVR